MKKSQISIRLIFEEAENHSINLKLYFRQGEQ